MHGVGRAVADALARAAGTVFIGFSGGRDSTVLLHAVAEQRRDRVVAVHVNHGLQEDAERWQGLCERTAAAFGVGFFARKVAVSGRGSLEARAREARYQVFFENLTQPDDRLFLAHHRHDQTETVLLRLLQGRGLYGMPRERALAAGRLVRPLLHLAPEEIEAYARRHGLSWINDPTNEDPRLDRNFLRHRILPELRRRWPDLDRSVNDAMLRRHLEQQRLTEPLGRLAELDSIELGPLMALSEAEGVELLRAWLAAHGIASPGRRALGELLRQLRRAHADRQPRLVTGDAALRRYGDRLYLVPPRPVLAPQYPLELPGVGHLPHGDLEVVERVGGFTPRGRVLVTFRRGGERLRYRGMNRSLKALFQEAGIPPWERDVYPLLVDDAGLLAVPDIAWRERHACADEGWQVSWRPR